MNIQKCIIILVTILFVAAKPLPLFSQETNENILDSSLNPLDENSITVTKALSIVAYKNRIPLGIELGIFEDYNNDGISKKNYSIKRKTNNIDELVEYYSGMDDRYTLNIENKRLLILRPKKSKEDKKKDILERVVEKYEFHQCGQRDDLYEDAAFKLIDEIGKDKSGLTIPYMRVRSGLYIPKEDECMNISASNKKVVDILNEIISFKDGGHWYIKNPIKGKNRWLSIYAY